MQNALPVDMKEILEMQKGDESYEAKVTGLTEDSIFCKVYLPDGIHGMEFDRAGHHIKGKNNGILKKK